MRLDLGPHIAGNAQRGHASQRYAGGRAERHRSDGSPFAAAAGRTPTKAEREAAEFKASYAVGDTTPSKIDLRKDLPGPMLLKSTEIVRYDHNPRLYTNEKRDDTLAELRQPSPNLIAPGPSASPASNHVTHRSAADSNLG